VKDDRVCQTVQIEEGPDFECLSLVVIVQCGGAEFEKLKGRGA